MLNRIRMTFGEQALKFYRELTPPDMQYPDYIEVLNPLKQEKVFNILKNFYGSYYNDNRERVFLIGINPGRFGGGITGIPFTDPVNLENILGIPNDLDKRHELSSRFIYDVILSIGGARKFFSNFYLTAVSPLGYTSNERNLNYYDVKAIREGWQQWFIDKLVEQINFGARTDIAYSLGKGKNIEFLNMINKKANLFEKIEALPHPRWVMQYRYKKREQYLKEYIKKLNSGSIESG